MSLVGLEGRPVVPFCLLEAPLYAGKPSQGAECSRIVWLQAQRLLEAFPRLGEASAHAEREAQARQRQSILRVLLDRTAQRRLRGCEFAFVPEQGSEVEIRESKTRLELNGTPERALRITIPTHAAQGRTQLGVHIGAALVEGKRLLQSLGRLGVPVLREQRVSLTKQNRQPSR